MKKLPTLLIALSFSLSSAFAQNLLAEHHFESSDITAVTVIGTFCDVNVTIGPKVIFDGKIEGDGKEGDYLIASMKSGNSVVFKVEQNRSKSGWNWNDIETARLDLTIPDGTILKIENTSGDLDISGPASSSYALQTTSGDISIEGLTGKLEVRATSGDLNVDKIVGSVESQTTSGDQSFDEISGSLQTRATSGDIEIRRFEGSLAAKATSGDVEVSTIVGSVNFMTTSGNIYATGFEITADSEARSTSGDITVRFENDIDEIGFELTATSGDLEVGSIDAEDKLMLRRGSFTFRGKSTSGDQEYD